MAESPLQDDDALPEADLTGRLMGDYLLLRRLGSGGMADVYLARQASLDREVAVKVLKKHLADSDDYVRRFQHEARAVASLVHANIVQIHEVGRFEGVHFLVQEYVPGENLRQMVQRNGPVGARLAVAILRQVAAALYKAATAGIVHRDIKPENILISDSGEVKVADFGLARLADATGGDTMNLTQAGMTMGTPLYMSPEQVEGRSLDPRSDVYSLGVTCYFMLAGRPPFQGETPLSIAVQHVKQQARPLGELRPELPEPLCLMVERMMAKSPDDRFATAAELLGQLRLVLQGQEDADEADVDDWGTAELLALAESHNAATRQLAGAMSASAALAVQTGRLSLWLPALVLLFVIGGGVAWLNRPASLLAISGKPGPGIERKDTPEAQYVFAAMLDSEEAWQSVWEHFPPDEGERNAYYALRAKQQLALLLIQQDDLPRSLALYEELAAVDPTEEQFRAYGLAGQAFVYSLQGKHRESADKLADLWPLRQHLDVQTRTRVEQLRDETRRALGPTSREPLEDSGS